MKKKKLIKLQNKTGPIYFLSNRDLKLTPCTGDNEIWWLFAGLYVSLSDLKIFHKKLGKLLEEVG